MLRFLRAICFVPVLFALTCGGEDDSGSGAGGQSSGGAASGHAEFCVGWDAALAGCPSLPTPESCAAYDPCFDAVLRAEARGDTRACLLDTACSFPGRKACYQETGVAVGETAAQKAFYSAHAAKNAECGSMVDLDLDSDADFPWQILRDETYEKLTVCLEEPCADVWGCFNDLWKSDFAASCGAITFEFFEDD